MPDLAWLLEIAALGANPVPTDGRNDPAVAAHVAPVAPPELELNLLLLERGAEEAQAKRRRQTEAARATGGSSR